MNDKYKPINCDFHEVLLEHATLKRKVAIVYFKNNKEESIIAVITDVYTKKGEEFLLLDNNEIIRLDFLISVNGEELPEISCTF